MQGDRLVFELILNIALLVLIANLISKFRLIQKARRFCQWFLAGWWFCQRIQELILAHTV